jgi:hypothetical protein
MFDFQLESDFSALSGIYKESKDAIEEALNLTTQSVQGEIAKEAPVDHGRLAGSFEMSGGGMNWHVFTNVEYALYVHEGTGIYGPNGSPFEIVAMGGGLYWSGAPHPVMRVLHPGMQGDPFADRALSTTESRVPDIVKTALSKTLSFSGGG